MRNKKFWFLMLGLIAFGSLILSSCAGAPSPDTEEPTEAEEQTSVEEQAPEVETEESLPEEKAEPAHPPDPQIVVIETEDGIQLNGTFYPAESASAPLIILTHWAPGDQRDWIEIAFWLQNRGMNGNSSFDEKTPWLDSSWFPALQTDKTYNVLTFTSRGCENGCSSFEGRNWYVDVMAAGDFAMQIDSVDNENIFTIGASIGADGAADGCAYLNATYPGVCKGAIALSPGNYLTIDFLEKVKELGSGDTPTPVWCLYAESDMESATVCKDITEENYTGISYPADSIFENGHGMNLLSPDQQPQPLELIRDALDMQL